MVTMVRLQYIAILLLTSFFVTSPAWAAVISARLDREKVEVNETFQIIYEADGSVKGDPDFSPIEQQFEIVNNSTSSSVSVINGLYSHKYLWTLTLVGNKPGQFEIPSIAFGKDRSPPLSVTVVPATISSATAQDIMLEVSIDPEDTYVQAQSIYVVRLLRSVNLNQASLSDPKVTGVDAIVEPLGEDVIYETQRSQKRYVVVERRYAIFPQSSGTMHIAPIQFEGQVLGSGGSPYDPFNVFNQNIRVRKTQSESLSVEVKPIPSSIKVNRWLPASKLRLIEQWPENTPKFKVGEPITRTILIMAHGLTAAQLPEIQQSLPDALKQYPDQPDLRDEKNNKGVVGIRQEKMAIVPTQSGTYTLPALEVPWWNTTTGKQEIARIAARTIQVAEAVGNATQQPQIGLNEVKPQEPANSPDTTTANPDKALSPITWVTDTRWVWLSAILAVGWMFTLVLWWISRRSVISTATKGSHPSNTSPTKSLQAIRRACNCNHAAECNAALVSWSKQMWPESPPKSLASMAKRTGGNLGAKLQELDRYLYGQPQNSGWRWDGESFWKVFQDEVKSSSSNVKKPKPTQLSPLYPGL